MAHCTFLPCQSLLMGLAQAFNTFQLCFEMKLVEEQSIYYHHPECRIFIDWSPMELTVSLDLIYYTGQMTVQRLSQTRRLARFVNSEFSELEPWLLSGLLTGLIAASQSGR